MGLPNYLAKIKSSGTYRYVFDKSVVPAQEAETLRLVIGYSEKGPFNTPVYIDNKPDFISLYGNINKRLEKKGVFFNRLALQALGAGPILALNIKPFDTENVSTLAFDPSKDITSLTPGTAKVSEIYDTNRFWKLDADQLPSKITGDKYINIAMTDVKDKSCSLFIRKTTPAEYNVTVSEWYANQSDQEMPDYLEQYASKKISDLFCEVYVFKGQFTEGLCKEGAPLSKYFTVSESVITIKDTIENTFKENIDTLDALADDPNSNFVGKYVGCILPYFKDYNGNYVSLDVLFNADYNTHSMLMKLDDDQVEKAIEAMVADDNKFFVKTPVYLAGYTYSTIGKTATAQSIQDSVFKEMSTKGLYTALTNGVDCQYHYIVDTFSSEIKKGCKGELTALAKAKFNTLAICNFPPMSKFIADSNYTSEITKKFDISKLPDSSKPFSLPTETDGASFGAFYTPIILSDGTVKTTVPSAALVSNLFMDKWDNRQPYDIVAGPNYGRITDSELVGPDYNYGRSDLDVLEPMGVNAIIYIPRKGTYINSNQTAKQTPVSALSKVNVRELVIYLQDEIDNMLQNYQWELNTQTLRDTIKTKADTICERIAANGGLYDYENVCDETNNTPEVIDNEMVILDMGIEPARGAGKMVQRLTIHRTGGLRTSM